MDDTQPTQKEDASQYICEEPNNEALISKANLNPFDQFSKFPGLELKQIVAKFSHAEVPAKDLLFTNRIIEHEDASYFIGLGPSNKIVAEFNDFNGALCRFYARPNIIKCWDVYVEPDRIYIFMEYMAGGDLLSHILEFGSLDEDYSRKWFSKIASAIKYLHGNNVTHRDIKLENILISLDDNNKICDIKLADFGLARMVGDNEMMKTMCGTPSYLAPEVFCNPREALYTKSVDVWSLGVVLYAMNTGEFPFVRMHLGGKINTETFIKSSQLVMSNEAFASLSASLRSLVTRCLEINPKARIDIDDILLHSWIYGLEYPENNDLGLIYELKEIWGFLQSAPDSSWKMRIELFQNFISAGRSTENVLVLQHERISRKSFEIIRSLPSPNISSEEQEDSIYLKRKSKTPIWVNGSEVEVNVLIKLSSGDVISLIRKSPNNKESLDLQFFRPKSKKRVRVSNYREVIQGSKSIKLIKGEAFDKSKDSVLLLPKEKEEAILAIQKPFERDWVCFQPNKLVPIKNHPNKKPEMIKDLCHNNLETTESPWSRIYVIKDGVYTEQCLLFESEYTVGRDKSKI
ncbi:hypothetical protein BB560_000473 [Smittium megazygosporum]|uniref:Protein kinase domain-containing protein n=1 Tax=Smittium megazygosporum TaxID=133381 RepID=A0A2T9ZKF8_9FUNG|nr:hypothetical protein BB560_000473 [Smittium megazygosporum]